MRYSPSLFKNICYSIQSRLILQFFKVQIASVLSVEIRAELESAFYARQIGASFILYTLAQECLFCTY